MLPLILMGEDMFLFVIRVLKMYLLNSQLNFHIKSLIFIYLIFFCLLKTICRKYMTQRLIHDIFHIIHDSLLKLKRITPEVFRIPIRDAQKGVPIQGMRYGVCDTSFRLTSISDIKNLNNEY